MSWGWVHFKQMNDTFKVNRKSKLTRFICLINVSGLIVIIKRLVLVILHKSLNKFLHLWNEFDSQELRLFFINFFARLKCIITIFISSVITESDEKVAYLLAHFQ